MTKPKKSFDIDIIFTPLVLISFLVFAFGFSNIGNYTYWLKTLIILVISGIVIGNIIYMILNLYIKDLNTYKNSNNIGIRSLLIASFIFISIGGGIKINETSDRNIDCRNFVIYDKATSTYRGNNYYFFIKNNGKRERLNVKRSLYESRQVGQKVKLCVTTGYLGFVYIKPKD